MAPSQTTTSTDLEVLPKAQLEAAYKAIIDGDVSALPPAADPEVMSRAILERIYSSKTFEEAFTPQKVPAWRDLLLGVPVRVQSVHFNRSGFDQGSPIYAIVDVADVETGEVTTVHCGGQNVLVQLVKMLEEGWQSRPVKLTSKLTAEKYGVLWLESV